MAGPLGRTRDSRGPPNETITGWNAITTKSANDFSTGGQAGNGGRPAFQRVVESRNLRGRLAKTENHIFRLNSNARQVIQSELREAVVHENNTQDPVEAMVRKCLLSVIRR